MTRSLWTFIGLLACSSFSLADEVCTATLAGLQPQYRKCGLQANRPSGAGVQHTLSSSTDPLGDCAVLCHSTQWCQSFGLTASDNTCTLFARRVIKLNVGKNNPQGDTVFYNSKCFDYTCTTLPPPCTNPIPNGDFSQGLTGWTSVNVLPSDEGAMKFVPFSQDSGSPQSLVIHTFPICSGGPMTLSYDYRIDSSTTSSWEVGFAQGGQTIFTTQQNFVPSSSTVDSLGNAPYEWHHHVTASFVADPSLPLQLQMVGQAQRSDPQSTISFDKFTLTLVS